jgi:hypothetical protein
MATVYSAGITILTLAFIVYSVVTGNKTIASLIQLGDIQRREEVNGQIQQAKKQNNPVPGPREDAPLSERLSFTVGVVNACLTTYILGAFPTQFYLWYTPKAIVLITLRWIDFRSKNQHYLLYDFCYWANGITLLYLWVMPRNQTLFQIVFLCANGPLAWSILAFNQAIVFHKWQQVVSVFIHVSPMLLTYGLRWYDQSDFTVCNDFPECYSVDSKTLILNAMLKFYLWWIVLYYVWIFICLGTYIESRSFKTLYDRVAGNQMKFLFGKGSALESFPHLVKKAVYMCTHVVFGAVTMTLASVFWTSRSAHMLFILTICACSCYNASKHYDEQFVSDRKT